MPEKRVSIADLIKEYFLAHPNQDMTHGPVVDYVEERYVELYGRKPRDPWRAIRSLHQQGFLIKVRNGVYHYDPDAASERVLEDFTTEQRNIILERDKHRCVICGRGERDGVQLHVDHIRPRNLGGRAIIENGQTLCAQHNFIKKQANQTETGKRMFIHLYELAEREGNPELMNFCADVLNVYAEHGINSHIEWIAT